MKPLSLKGHDRALTKVKYNREGDLLFTAGKDASPSVWYSENGERLGTYSGHNGVIWCLDAAWDSASILTGSGDNYCKLWDTQTGKVRHNISANTSVRSVGFSYSGNLFFLATDQRMNFTCTLNIYDARDHSSMESTRPQLSIPVQKSKVTSGIWSNLDYMIITGHDSGEICQYDIRTTSSEPVNFVQEHRRQITDLQPSHDQIMVISSSKDQTAKLFDAHTLDHLKTYKSEKPVNSSAIAPFRDHVIIGGGEDAMQVTQTDTREGQFDAKVYHLVFEDEFARIKGHFGPINTLAIHPDGRSLATGSEDGFVRLNVFDDDYYDFEFEY